MRSVSKITCDKPIAPVKSASITRASASYKIPSMELKSSSSHGGCGNDASLQSGNTRRRFQRRGSKSPSMFKLSHFEIPDTLFDNIRTKSSNPRNNNVFLESAAQIQKGSERSYSSATDSMLEDISESTDADEFAC